ncbi:hypothetical protein AVEN_218383-1 [Araneus ventricosus]|uniref:Uncharacterized protein n=1 Tax=Araneus ventricosus TaxID=182803 RepID=A0A4Y2MCL5_ARAVE|nr:hypothetical protein AVEN_100984-1 [Araneus ventricosus]GBN24277.1 hypothetical protein AVEN_111198-1 [Araneus ventricosus]GBN24322.1 hypothetical protein AVEN_183752-1 [Araneus ventricosus]GBN24359.1 hypothetical protein AVEN_218383-1 [Araneus ventricosus]
MGDEESIVQNVLQGNDPGRFFFVEKIKFLFQFSCLKLGIKYVKIDLPISVEANKKYVESGFGENKSQGSHPKPVHMEERTLSLVHSRGECAKDKGRAVVNLGFGRAPPLRYKKFCTVKPLRTATPA